MKLAVEQMPGLNGLHQGWVSIVMQAWLAELPDNWYGRKVREGWNGESIIGWALFRRWLSKRQAALDAHVIELEAQLAEVKRQAGGKRG